MVNLVLVNGKEIKVTSNHPIYMPEHAAFKWAGSFEHGDLVMLENGMQFMIDYVEILGPISEIVYNFETEMNHTYIAEDVFVHNGSGGGGDSGGGGK